MADELGAWAGSWKELKVTLAIKAHSKTAMSRPNERSGWGPAKSPPRKAGYDYSPHAAFGLDMRKPWSKSCGSVFVHIKDTIGAVPTTDLCSRRWARWTQSLYQEPVELGYRGPVVVEV